MKLTLAISLGYAIWANIHAMNGQMQDAIMVMLIAIFCAVFSLGIEKSK